MTEIKIRQGKNKINLIFESINMLSFLSFDKLVR